jgi:hypothetical protein
MKEIERRYLSGEEAGFFEARHQGAACNMQKRHGRINGARLQRGVLESNAHEFAIQSER